MLIGTDIIGLKIIDIIISKKQVYIGLYKITVTIDFKPRSKGIIYKLVVANQDTTIALYQATVIPIYYTSLPEDRDFLFEPKTNAVSLYTQLINANFAAVIGRNDINQPIYMPRHLRFSSITKIDYDNYYLIINNNSTDLAISSLRFKQKNI